MQEPSQEQMAFVAGNRYGLGLRPDELTKVASAPLGWLQAQLQDIATIPPLLAQAGTTTHNLVAALEARRLQQQLQARGTSASAQEKELLADDRLQQVLHPRWRMAHAIGTDRPFAERLVRFWSNHFSITRGDGIKSVLRRIALPYENEAIRARLDGSFANLLLAVVRHPAMLLYLDNYLSVGPDSPAGKVGGQGLNENLGRELLELFTLGVDAGYKQQDVVAMARMLTGWTVDLGQRGTTPETGQFTFNAAMHQPGTQVLLGKSYPAAGQEQAELALQDLALHPATARHVARKLARHFIADVPPEWAVAKLEAVYLDSGGSLPELHAAMAELLPDITTYPAARKLRTAEEFVIAAARAVLVAPTAATLQGLAQTLDTALVILGQAAFEAPSPAGWPDAAEYWGSPSALLKRVKWAQSLQSVLPATLPASKLYAALLPQQAVLAQELAALADNKQALALLLASPQFQWR